jgi:hypothetical protein
MVVAVVVVKLVEHPLVAEVVWEYLAKGLMVLVVQVTLRQVVEVAVEAVMEILEV